MTAAAVATAATTAETTWFAFGHGTSFVDDNVSALHVRAVEFFNRGLSFLFAGHFHKAKALAAAGELVGNNVSGDDCTDLREEILQFIAGNSERQTAYKKFSCHNTFYVLGSIVKVKNLTHFP